MKISERGFTLLLAALIASVVLSIASAIFSIAQKQVTLASLSQQSQYAFYAADTGAECALYWDSRYGYFSSTTPYITPHCDTTKTLSISFDNSTTFLTNPYIRKFTLALQNNYCTVVKVQKCVGSITSNGLCCPNTGYNSATDACNATVVTTLNTQIRADGYNVSCASLASNNPITLQRSVVLNY